MKYSKIQIILYTFIVLNLHILRNISVFYLYFLFIPFLYSAFVFIKNFLIEKKINIISYFFLTFYLYTIGISIFWFILGDLYFELETLILGISRLVFTLPFFIMTYDYKWTDKEVNKIIIIFSIFCGFASATVPLQFITGVPVSWFSESSMREGVVRYASLFGNLTSIGILGGLGIIATFYSHMRWQYKTIIYGFIFLALSLSLQKAAVANGPIALFISLFFKNGSIKKTMIVSFKKIPQFLIFICIVFFLGRVIGGDAVYVTYGNFRMQNSKSLIVEKNQHNMFNQLFTSKQRNFNEDQTVIESIKTRIWKLPYLVFSQFSFNKLFWGIGIAGGAGSLGCVDFQMTHNNFADLILMGGLIIGWFPIFLIFYSLYVLFSLKEKNISKVKCNNVNFAKTSLLYVLLNMFFASGVLAQPNSSIIVVFIMGLIAAGYFNGSSSVGQVNRE